MTNFDRFKDRFPRYTPLLAAALIAALGLGIVACSDAVTPPDADDASDDATAQTSSADGEEVFVSVEDPPELVGGIAALQEAIEYPEFAKKAGIEGRVFVQFIVDEQGNVTNPQVTRGVHKLLDEAALEAVRKMQFKPGQQRGQAVKVQMSLPVTFKLPSEDASDEATSMHESSDTEQIQVAIRADGSVHLDGAATSIDDVADVLRARMARSGTKSPVVSLRVDGNASMGIVNDVQEQLRHAESLRNNYSSKRSTS